MGTIILFIMVALVIAAMVVVLVRHNKAKNAPETEDEDVDEEDVSFMLRETEKLGEDGFLRKKLELPSGKRISDMELLQLTKRDLKNMSQEDVACIANYSCNQSLNKKPQFDGLYMMAYDALKR